MWWYRSRLHSCVFNLLLLASYYSHVIKCTNDKVQNKYFRLLNLLYTQWKICFLLRVSGSCQNLCPCKPNKKNPNTVWLKISVFLILPPINIYTKSKAIKQSIAFNFFWLGAVWIFADTKKSKTADITINFGQIEWLKKTYIQMPRS